MRTEILKILREKAPEPVSGEELADCDIFQHFDPSPKADKIARLQS